MRFEYEGRLFRILVELTAGSAAAERRLALARVASRSEHELRRELFRRTVDGIKGRAEESEE